VKPFSRLLIAALMLALPFVTGQAARAADLSYPIDQVLGKPDAPITVIEYASTTCPHCAHFHKDTLPKFKAEWVDTGKAKLIYRDFPTGPRGLSVGASMIAHCAGPDRYFGLLGLIMDQQEKWMGSQNPLVELKKLAKLAGMDEAKVDDCLKRQDLASAITQRAQDANEKLGVDSTPSLIINGKLIPGAIPYEEMDKALKAASK
jgi:protein-disulfide isomerase